MYNDEDANDLSDLGIGTSSGKSSVSGDTHDDTHSVLVRIYSNICVICALRQLAIKNSNSDSVKSIDVNSMINYNFFKFINLYKKTFAFLNNSTREFVIVLVTKF